MEENKDKAKKPLVRSKNPIQNYGLEAGKVPPQAVDLEQAVLGAMMLDKNAKKIKGICANEF